MSKLKHLFFPLIAGILIFTLGGCKSEGPAERAGEKIDKAVEKAGEKLEKAGDKVKEAFK